MPNHCLCTLYSGSSGNATFIGDRSGGILVDVGRNAKQTTLALEALDLSPECVRAIFLTHEHSDHIAGLRVFANRHRIPVYASLGTLEALDLGGHLRGDFPVFQMTDFADVADFHVECFHTSHDCAEGLGYTVTLPDGKRVSVATDLGVMTEEVRSSILGSRTVLLESNHDLGMLFNGPYPYVLKQRISSDVGHLNNDAAAATALDLLKSGTKQLILGHLSAENNYPQLAYQTTASMLLSEGAKAGDDYLLDVAPRSTVLRTEVV